MNPLVRTLLRGTGYLAGGLVVLLLATVVAVYGVSEYRFRHPYEVPAVEAAYPPTRTVGFQSDSLLVERGAHVAATRGCNDCHGADFGGQVMIDDPAFGHISTSNLTTGRGGVGTAYTDADWDRALRHGVRPDGRGLLIMPSGEYHSMSDSDMEALVAFLRQVPPVDRTPDPNSVGPIGRFLVATGQFGVWSAADIDHAAARPEAPAPGPTAAYGAYLMTSCQGCHGPDFAGQSLPGSAPGAPPSANLTPDSQTGLGTWTEADFRAALRTGVRPDGSHLDASMPVAMTAQYTDTEVAAMWAYVQTLEPVVSEK